MTWRSEVGQLCLAYDHEPGAAFQCSAPLCTAEAAQGLAGSPVSHLGQAPLYSSLHVPTGHEPGQKDKGKTIFPLASAMMRPRGLATRKLQQKLHAPPFLLSSIAFLFCLKHQPDLSFPPHPAFGSPVPPRSFLTPTFPLVWRSLWCREGLQKKSQTPVTVEPPAVGCWHQPRFSGSRDRCPERQAPHEGPPSSGLFVLPERPSGAWPMHMHPDSSPAPSSPGQVTSTCHLVPEIVWASIFI